MCDPRHHCRVGSVVRIAKPEMRDGTINTGLLDENAVEKGVIGRGVDDDLASLASFGSSN